MFGGTYYCNNWPRSLYLAEDDIGFNAWDDGRANTKYYIYNAAGEAVDTKYNGISDTQIINELGLATITFAANPKVYYHVYTSTRTPTDKSLPELNALTLAEQLKHSKQVDDKSSWTCINPEGTTPTYEKITQSNGTQVDLYYATNDSTLTTLLAAHQLNR